MRLYVNDMDSFFAWMDTEGYQYVVLRGFEDYARGYPRAGGKQDVDLLVEDRAIQPVWERYHRTPKWKGVKCDVYSVSTGVGADYLGHGYFPKELALNILRRRMRWEDRFFVPCDEDHFYSLVYHIAYQKAETSGLDYSDPAAGRSTKYFPVVQRLAEHVGVRVDMTLTGLHGVLGTRGYGIDKGRLRDYIRNDFHHGRKSFFYARLADAEQGELNLFVIRKVAVKVGKHQELIDALARQYRIIRIKDIPWHVRWRNSKHMRGGKWRRGGRPYIAVVVYDPNPVNTDAEDRKVHPFVFNRNQFVKRDLRDWVIANADIRPKDNAIHSTDNEAEAIGHLPLFFSDAEQAEIFAELDGLRKQDRDVSPPLSGSGVV